MSDTKSLLSVSVRERLQRLGPLIVFVVILTAVTSAAPGLLRWRAINSLLTDNSPLLITTIGLTFPILLGCLGSFGRGDGFAVGGLRRSVGAVVRFFRRYYRRCGRCGVGWLQGYMIGKFQIPSFVMTLGALGIFKGLALYLTAGNMVGITPGMTLYDTLSGQTAGISNTLILVVVVVVVQSALLQFTHLGRNIYAFGANELAAYVRA
jgi:ribose transport system permease protein